MRRLLSRLGNAFLRLMSDYGAMLAAVPDPHGQFPGTPIPWHVPDVAQVVIPEQPNGPPPGHPDHP
jgi:hypothetical protein